jgi:broad specificity phosphatase PhoE
MGTVLIVRHGQASFGAEDYDVLSETGVSQSARLGEALAESGVVATALVSGAMRRQRDTATAMARAAGWDVDLEVDEGWNEFDHLGVVARGPSVGVGMDRRDFQAAFVAATDRWNGGQHDEEYDETWSAFVSRVTAGLDGASEREGTTVVVSSGGPIAVACALLIDPRATPAELPRLWNAFNTVCVNTGVTRAVTGSTGRRLLTFNEHSHLARDQVTYR